MFASNELKLFDDGQRLFLTTDERHKFRQTLLTLNTKQRLFCRLMYYTGCKIAEAIVFLPEHIDRQNNCILLGKNGKYLLERHVPVPAAFTIELVTYLIQKNEPNTSTLLSISRAQGWRLIKDAMSKSGIEGKHATPTGLRHSFAISCLEMNPPIPIEHIQKWMGYSQANMVSSYLSAFKQDEDESIKKLWEYL